MDHQINSDFVERTFATGVELMISKCTLALSGGRLTAVVVACFVLCAALTGVNAAPIAYTGATNGTWNNSANWTPASIPGTGDDAQFNTNTRNINLSDNRVVNSLAFTVSNQQIAGASNAVNSAGNLTINNGVTHSNNSGSTFFRIPTITLANSQIWDLNGLQGTAGGSAAGLTITPPTSVGLNNFVLGGNTLTKNGTGQLSFGGMNIGAGSFDINAGSIRFSGGNGGTNVAISGAGTISVAANAALLLGANGSNVTITGKTIQMNGGGTSGTAALLNYGNSSASNSLPQNIAANIQWTGFSNVDSEMLASAAGLATPGNRAWTFSGDWSGAGTITFRLLGAGVYVSTFNSPTILSGNNSGLTGYINNTHNQDFRGVNFGSVNSGSASAEWGLNHANAVYRLNGFDVNLGALSGTAGTLVNGHASTAATATLGGKNINSSFAGTIANGAAASLSIVKTGTGIQTLTNNNTYTGSTTINIGTLELTGAGQLSGTSGIAINGANAQFLTFSSVAVTAPITLTSGLIGGTGAINTPVTIGTGGTVSPGASPGTQEYLAGQTWANSGTYLWEINEVDTANVLQDTLKGISTGHDWLDITGTLAVTADTFNPFVIELSSMGAAVTNWDNTQDYTWTIVTASTAVTGFAANLFSLDTSGFTANNALDPMGVFSISADANNVYLHYNVVPEPSSLALLMFGAMTVMAVFRKRNR
jgi:autotransporter-associated beta strand protein